MNPKRSCWMLVLLLIASPLCLAAEVRTWTDKQGKTMKGEFVRVFEGRVVLKSGNKTTQVPLSQLSQADQEYIEAELNRKVNKVGEGQPVRIWTDTRGNQIVAAFVRMEESQVVLQESGKARSIAFVEISPADRMHLKELLRGQGQDQLVSTLERLEEEAAKAAEAARQAAAQGAPAPSAPPVNPIFEQMRQQEEARRQLYEQQQAQRQQEEAQRRQAFEAQQAAEREQAGAQLEESRQRQIEQQQRFQQQQQESMQRMQQSMANLSSSATGPTMVTEYRCSNCNAVVPDSIGAGGNCPSCGVYFEYTTTPSGQRQYASGSSSSDSGRWKISGRGIRGIFFLVVLVCGGIAALWKKIAGE